MGNEDLLKLIEIYHSEPGSDKDICERMIKFLEGTPNCFDRQNKNGHFTASAWVIDKDGEKTLLTHHRKLGKWVQLGGHADGDSDLLRVACREVEEESGLKQLRVLTPNIFDLDIHAIPARINEPEHLHYDVRFLLQADSKADLTMSEESKDLQWVHRRLLSTLSPDLALHRMNEKWEAFRKASILSW